MPTLYWAIPELAIARLVLFLPCHKEMIVDRGTVYADGAYPAKPGTHS